MICRCLSVIRLYADDAKLGGKMDSEMEWAVLQSDLDQLSEWAEKWQLGFNMAKCKVMHIGSRNKKMEYRMQQHVDGKVVTTDLQETMEEKDLGVWMTSNMKSSVHVSHAVSKANQILGLIKRCFTYRDPELVKKLYTVMVRPHLEYGNVVWHPQYKGDIARLESVQRRATKLIPRLHNLSYEERLRELKLPSLVYRRLRGDSIEVYK